jgi:DNA-binding XRE family transcriptional regulator
MDTVPNEGEPDVGAARSEQLEESIAWVIAQRLREFRLQLGMTVGELAKRSGLSKGMLSKLENAQASPSLSTLARLATAMSVPVTAFMRGLEEESDAVFVKSGQGPEIVRRGTRAGHHYQLLGSSRAPYRMMVPLLVTLDEQREVFPLFQHPGIELIYMLEGVMEYGHGTGRYVLEQGDALQFTGEITHGPSRLLTLPIRFISITVDASGETRSKPSKPARLR